jgi:signal transduction histidine kinase
VSLAVRLLNQLGSRPATALRLAGLLGLIFWQTQATAAARFHGQGLAIGVMLAVASLGWIVWAWRLGESRQILGRGSDWELWLMAVGGGLLVGISPSGPSNVFVFVAAFSSAARVGIPRGFIICGLAIAAVGVSWIVYHDGGLGVLAYSLGLIATSFGGAQRYDGIVRRDQAELLLAQSQRSYEEQLRAAKLEASSTLARDIHDVLAHALAGLTIQLEATTALLENGADAQTVLPRVRRAHALAREGLRETRLAVGVLRGEDSALSPAAVRIEALVGDFTAAGGVAELHLDGARERLTGAVGDAAVRIVQETLTNVTKHSPGARVSIAVTTGLPLSLTVHSHTPAGVNAQRGSLASSGGGYGITGMRERAEALGGSLAAGPTADGWLVRAVLGAEAA